MMKKLISLIYICFLISAFALSFGLTQIPRAKADDCTIELQRDLSLDGKNIDFAYVVNLYTLQSTDQVLFIGGPTLQNLKEEDVTSTPSFSKPKPTTNYNYRVGVFDSATNNPRCLSVPVVYTSSSGTFAGGQALSTNRVPQTPINPAGTGVWTDFGPANNLGEYVSLILRWAEPIIAIFAFLMIIYAGYTYMTSQGDPKALDLAKEIILGVVAGIVLFFCVELLLRNVIGTKYL